MKSLLPGAQITALASDGITGVTEHPQLAAAADQQPLEQIVVLFIIPRGALFIPLELLARLLPSFPINDSRDFNGDPFFTRASHTTGVVFARGSIAGHISAFGRDM